MQTALCKLLGIEVPIIQAPMGGAVGPAIAAAVSNAGALGMLVLWRADLETVRRQIRKTRSLTRRPFGVNLNLEFPQDERLAVCLDEGVPIISFFWRDPARSCRAPRQEMRSSCTRSARPRGRAEPSIAASMSSLRRAGKRAATCAERVAAWEAAGRPPSGKRPGEGEVIATSKISGQIVRYQSYTPGADAEGDIEALSLWAGQSVGLVSRVQPASEIVREIAEEARAILGKLPS
jgi:NAD(P)H-dependent flavin oxidoreductase YrpB (nitropropane dioxygenase family)